MINKEEIGKMKELGYSYSTAFDGVFIKLEAMEPKIDYGDTYNIKAARSTEAEEEADGALLADGFEEALIGFGHQFNYPVAVYSRSRCMDILMKRDKMSSEEAIEYFNFNVVGAWMGESTPIFLDDEFDMDETT